MLGVVVPTEPPAITVPSQILPVSDIFLFSCSTPVPCLLLSTFWNHLPLEVDPCANGHGGCSPHANCTKVAPGQRTCTCQDGYTGDGELCQGEAETPNLHACGARALKSAV